MTNTHLLLIDPQNDFCDPSGSLYVRGADDDIEVIGDLINNYPLDEIHISMDWHHMMDIAHPWWFTHVESGKHPGEFSMIKAQQLKEGVFTTTVAEDFDDTLAYLENLEKSGKYTHTIWPEHCLIGTWGSNLHEALIGPLDDWSMDTRKQVNYILKGQNPRTEHFSAVKAEVSLTGCPETWTNTRLMTSLYMANTILVAGEASSHCVAATVRDILEQDGRLGKKMKILTDCMSPVPHFKKFEEEFFDEMEHRGVKLTQSDKL